MIKEYYIAQSRMNARIADTVLPGVHINMDGISYERITKAPAGRRAVQRLINEDTNTRITIYA